jgi:hypothetical protein
MAAMNESQALAMGYSPDKRKRRNQHRTAARKMFAGGGSILGSLGHWHLSQARAI